MALTGLTGLTNFPTILHMDLLSFDCSRTCCSLILSRLGLYMTLSSNPDRVGLSGAKDLYVTSHVVFFKDRSASLLARSWSVSQGPFLSCHIILRNLFGILICVLNVDSRLAAAVTIKPNNTCQIFSSVSKVTPHLSLSSRNASPNPLKIDAFPDAPRQIEATRTGSVST